MSENVLVGQDGRHLSIRLNRPESRNAITVAMYAAMADAVEQAGSDDGIDLVTISGEGVDFTAGNDLMDFMAEMPQPGENTDIPVWRFLRAMAKNEVPIIAKVHGNAIGIGTTMLFHCDLVVAADNARFKMPFTELGLVPEAASSLIMPELAGRRAAARYLLLGESFGAAEAKSVGLVSHVAPAGDLDAKFDEVVTTLLSRPPEAMRLTQKLLRTSDRHAILERMDHENGHFAERLTSDELKQAVMQFFAARGGGN
ncbi:enoyl-CoA hydratase-related protein [Sphingomicrobium sediminis]|uniref:Enoyl-CoA hydratase-related protein n=1 Tax=Sphingomicrobium sediminis TaxID=2950949 RepID=A0A9X2EI58_9SPHN|nr:enoyl-CoA hydratase-related protein [Sphingomicrobium sediminis]MCM8557191.1 enoyl-CoA hydratase-related protein [Sphingomicrobium sediminis]